jgi:hypothetical protein
VSGGGSKYEGRVARLEREAAPRTKRVKFGPTGPASDAVTPAERVATLEMIRHQLLFGAPAETGPFPSRALHPRAASLFRAQALRTREFVELEAQIAANPRTGPRLFGSDWRDVAPVFGLGSAPRQRKRGPLEQVDVNAWRRELWAVFLASDEGRAAIEAGRLVPSASQDEHAPEHAPQATLGERHDHP